MTFKPTVLRQNPIENYVGWEIWFFGLFDGGIFSD
jgi:hypothetical protein